LEDMGIIMHEVVFCEPWFGLPISYSPPPHWGLFWGSNIMTFLGCVPLCIFFCHLFYPFMEKHRRKRWVSFSQL